MTLAEWLLEQVAEDTDRVVHEFDCERFNVHDYGLRQGACDCTATAQLLAQCEATRRIVELHYSWHLQAERMSDPPFASILKAQASTADAILRVLALPYADRPGYDESWRP